MTVMRTCKHCKRPRAYLYSARELCRNCYYDLDVRALYEIPDRYVNSGARRVLLDEVDQHCTSDFESEPTPYYPGTESKIRVLIERRSKRQPLFHPLDAGTGSLAGLINRGEE